jgi:hypothetical protein
MIAVLVVERHQPVLPVISPGSLGPSAASGTSPGSLGIGQAERALRGSSDGVFVWPPRSAGGPLATSEEQSGSILAAEAHQVTGFITSVASVADYGLFCGRL